MRALRYHAFGRPHEVLRLEDVPAPRPGPGEVRLRLSHRSVNPADLFTIAGRYGDRPAFPAVGGHEGVGVIDALGEGVAGLEVGQRVVPLGAEGTWQEQVVLAAEACLPVPEGVPDEAAAQLFVNPLTAQLLLEALVLPEGAWLLQTAASSQVGRIVVQLARRRGLRTVNLVRRKDARAELEALGADVVLVAEGGGEEALRETILEVTGGGAAGALDAVMGETGGLAARCLAEEGTMLVYGGLSGEPLPLDVATLIYRRAEVRGFWRTAWFRAHPLASARAALVPLLALLAEGALALPVAATYDLADFAEALRHTREAGRGGKVLLTG